MTIAEAIARDAAAADYLLKDSTSGDSADHELRGGPTWFFLDVEDDPDESARVIIELPPYQVVRAFRDSGVLTIKLRTQYTPTDGTEDTDDYATVQGGASDLENLIFSVTDGYNIRLYVRSDTK
jgi:hypothetical protein